MPNTIGLTASPKAQSVKITWHTASEKDNNYFDIQRSNDGSTFQTIGQIKGNGTTATPQDYAFTDDAAANGINYYRLQQVDFDGTMAISKAVSAYVGSGKTVFKVFPSVTKDVVNVEFKTDDAAAELTISNVAGQVVKRQKLENTEGYLTVNLSDLPNGSYIVRLLSDKAGLMQRIEKQ